MNDLDLALDHVGLGIRDLSAASAAYERLGFTLSPLSMHAGSVTPGGLPVPWGSGNRCAMFRQGYLELLGLVDPALPSNVKGMVERYEGLHIVALDCANAQAASRTLSAAGVAVAEPVVLERDATYGARDEQVRRARFRNVYLDQISHPEARFIVIEHETRDVLWQPHLLEHANGVQALSSVTLAVPDLQTSVTRLTPMLGAPSRLAQGYTYLTRQGAVHVMDVEAALRFSPVLQRHDVHRVAAVTFAVRSLATLEAFLTERGIPFIVDAATHSGPRSVWVGPEHAAHAALQFIQLV